MSLAEWRALVEAFVEGRLSAEAFERRFMEAYARPVPPAIETLFYAVEAFARQQDGRTEHDADETELKQAARVALRELREDTAAPTRTYDRARTREEFSRFQIRMQRLAGIGCFIVLAWVALCILQIYYVSELIQGALGWGAWPSAIVGFFLAFIPIVGNILAFMGATREGWETWIAAIVFFAAPAATILSGWGRWRRWRS
jgi:hypothetical protein